MFELKKCNVAFSQVSDVMFPESAHKSEHNTEVVILNVYKFHKTRYGL